MNCISIHSFGEIGSLSHERCTYTQNPVCTTTTLVYTVYNGDEAKIHSIHRHLYIAI